MIWQEPKENYSKLPHQFFNDVMPNVSSLSEMKVILYILRHTWGYHQDERTISNDEFCKGRKKADGGRIDGGCGMSENAVRDGLNRAVEHGFISVIIDDSDKARIKKTFSLSMPDESTPSEVEDQEKDLTLPPSEVEGQTLKSCTSDPQELRIGVPEVEDRTKKDTLERNLGKKTKKENLSPVGDSVRYVESSTGTFHIVTTQGDVLCRRLFDHAPGKNTPTDDSQVCKNCLKKHQRKANPPRLNKLTPELKNYVASAYFGWHDPDVITGDNWKLVVNVLNQIFNVHEQYQTVCDVDLHLTGFPVWYRRENPRLNLPLRNGMEKHYADYYAAKKAEQDKLIALQEQMTMPDEIENIPTPPGNDATPDAEEMDFSQMDWIEQQIKEAADFQRNKGRLEYKRQQALRRAQRQNKDAS